MTKPYEIDRMLVLSTAHLPAREREELTRIENEYCVSVDDYGWNFAAREDESDVVKFPVLASLKALARKLDCTLLRLDVDGQERDDLPLFALEE